MFRKIGLLISLIVLINCVICEQLGDVEVFNQNYNRDQRNARDLVYRIYEVIPPKPEPSWKASAMIVSDNPDMAGLSGEITFKQLGFFNSPVMVNMNISGLPPGKHSVHVHSFGDLSEGCKSTGPHFRSNIIGNIETKDDGTTNVEYETLNINLFGLSGIVGRSIVIHEKHSEYLKYPDLFAPIEPQVSFQTEEDSVGERLACGIITVTNNV